MIFLFLFWLLTPPGYTEPDPLSTANETVGKTVPAENEATENQATDQVSDQKQSDGETTVWLLPLLSGMAAAGGVGLWAFFALRRARVREGDLRAQLLQGNRESQARNDELLEKNKELITFDEIVRGINDEVRIEPLLEILLQQGMRLFRYADGGAFLIYDRAEERFRFASAVGTDLMGLTRIRFEPEEAMARYVYGKEYLEDGIYLINEPSLLPELKELISYAPARAMVTITLTLEKRIEGFLVLETYREMNFLPKVEIEKLVRFRRHAISALAKARTFQDLEDTTRFLRETRLQLMKTAHDVGMAEVANNVVHQAGNSLNSISTTVEQIHALMNGSALKLFSRIAELLARHQEDLPAFLTEDKQGKKVPEALIHVADSLKEHQEALYGETKELLELVDGLRHSLSDQQQSVGRHENLAEMNIRECLEEILTSERPLIEAHRVHIDRDYRDVPRVTLPEVKFRRVLMALITNAVEAMEKQRGQRRLTVRCLTVAESRFRVEIQDTGIGIASDNRAYLFNQGFTTKKKGSSFGLHYCANAVKEMGGRIDFSSQGIGKGSTFFVELPCNQKDPVHLE
jgi:signal transduction histidine kinase